MTVDRETEIETDAGADAPELLRGYAAEVEDVQSQGDRRWVVARINTDALDSYGTVVDPRGMDKSEYDRNRVVLWEHGQDPVRGMVPIGRNDWIKAEPGRGVVKAKTVFADDEFSRGLHALYRDDVLRGWSVRGVPVQTGPPTRAEIERRPELAKCQTIYRKWRLKEYSAVAIAGNLDAVTEACSRGAWLPEVVRSMAESAGASGGYTTKTEDGRRPAPYGYCPKCGAKGVARERRPDGDDVCESGCAYPSRSALSEPPPAPARSAANPLEGLPPLVVRRTFDDVLASVERRARDLARKEAREALDSALDFAKGKV